MGDIKMPLTITKSDITELNVDAIVNAANPALRKGGGVCGAIFRAAGWSELQEACTKLAPINTGEAVITSGFKLPAKYIIHTVGPRYDFIKKMGSDDLLRVAYETSLDLAIKNDCKSIAFPLLSSGAYGYPIPTAFRIAIDTINEFITEHRIAVYLVLFNADVISYYESTYDSFDFSHTELA
jgi:O-acetyl-ADP-ribose deacetylase (regulator of RNase III)